MKLQQICASRTVDAIIAEKTQMERDFRKLFVRCLKKTSNFQEDNFGFAIDPNAEAACKVIREIESEARIDCSWFSEDELTDSIINTIVNGLIFQIVALPYFFIYMKKMKVKMRMTVTWIRKQMEHLLYTVICFVSNY